MHQIGNLLRASKTGKVSDIAIRHAVVFHNHELPVKESLNMLKIVDKFEEMIVLDRLGIPLDAILTELELYGG